jgi:Integrase core domain
MAKGLGGDNIFVERLRRSAKYEEVYLRAYRSATEARASIGRDLDFYNGRRPHSSLDHMTPDKSLVHTGGLRGRIGREWRVVFMCAFAAIGVWNATRGTFLQRVARRTAFLLALVLSGCSALPRAKEDMPAMGPNPAYGAMIAKYIKTNMTGSESYDAFEISNARWVHSVNGWTWLICVRYLDHGLRRTYAFYIEEGTKELDMENLTCAAAKIGSRCDATRPRYRYAVQSDACGAQTYSPFNLTTGATGPTAVGDQGPLY